MQYHLPGHEGVVEYEAAGRVFRYLLRHLPNVKAMKQMCDCCSCILHMIADTIKNLIKKFHKNSLNYCLCTMLLFCKSRITLISTKILNGILIPEWQDYINKLQSILSA